MFEKNMKILENYKKSEIIWNKQNLKFIELLLKSMASYPMLQTSQPYAVQECGTLPTSRTSNDIRLWYLSCATASSCVTSMKDCPFTSRIWSPTWKEIISIIVNARQETSIYFDSIKIKLPLEIFLSGHYVSHIKDLLLMDLPNVIILVMGPGIRSKTTCKG